MKQKDLTYLVVAILFLTGCGTSSTQAVPTVDIGPIQTAAANTFVAGINQTSTSNAPMNFPEQTSTPTFTHTLTSEFTPTITLTPQPTLPAGVASCIPQDTLRETALVLGIVDGDTINVQINGEILPVHYIGVDAPETGKEYYGQAAQINQDLVYSKTVILIKDVSDVDNKGVLLRYVIIDNVFVNFEIVKRGYAHAVSLPPDIACSNTLANAQSQAQAGNLGLWIPTLAPNLPPAGGVSFDNNGDGKVTCADFSTRSQALAALQAGYTNLDSDGDGIPCESLP